MTGAGRGIGKAIAVAYAAEDASVVCAARTEEEIEATAAEIESLGGRAVAVQTDVTDLESGERTQLSHQFGNTAHPRFSQDGKRVLYACSQEGDYDIYSIELKAKELEFKEDKLDDLFKEKSEEKKSDKKDDKKDGEKDGAETNSGGGSTGGGGGGGGG